MTRRMVMVTLAVLGLSAPAAGQSVILVRHAERADTTAGAAPTMAADPDLSEVGHARARRLAELLRDAGITAIYVTQYKRTLQTAAPLARALGITPTVIAASETATLVERLRAATGHALVVGHSNTVPDVAAALAGTPPITIGNAEYDNLIVVTLGSRPAVLRLRY